MKKLNTSRSVLYAAVALTMASCSKPAPIDHASPAVAKGDSLFDGKTLNGWRGDTTYWRVENGNMVGEITPATILERNSFIIYDGDVPPDFELTLEFRITEDGNSGVNYRSVSVDGVPHALRGYQADIDGQNRYTGQNYEERGRTTLAYRSEIVTVKQPVESDAQNSLKNNVRSNAWMTREITGSLGTADSLATFIHKGDWNTCRLLVKGNHLQHFINDVLMSDVTDNDTLNGKADGKLGVQVHVGPPMKVEYRRFFLKDISTH